MSYVEQPDFKSWTIQGATAATSAQIATCIDERIKAYTEDNITGRELHALWILDFEFFSNTEYKNTTIQTRLLRDFLRSRNVFVPRKGHSIAVELPKAQHATWEAIPEACLHEIKEKHRPISTVSKSSSTFRSDSARSQGDTLISNNNSFFSLMKI
ncbi:BgtAc-30368 [Blumeria graminis f. sp. tritici]|uniref:BgtAc-30368 n=2 Tax=Blumeria graminis f. sp. tritici TaxID=62690 RepID=A0A9X9LAN3_BLUGR|nr:hypothetical protein BGT96224_Ac30368 [Blumeria graminis f. sp. tritici 96224]VCU40378.1 BgtAc-30368 [Blumeria graminis f. sp. tritici]